jgi:type IV pilus assembly protein PilV
MAVAMLKSPRQSGFGLVEVLVTVLILAVGLLSAASLQLLSKRSNYDAAQRTTAAHLAQDLLERMRSNSAALIDYVPVGSLGGDTLGDAPAVDCSDPGTDCAPADLAGYDLWQWEDLLDGELENAGGAAAGGLSSPTACVSGPAFGGTGTYSIAIAWRGMTEIADPEVDDCGAGEGKYGDDDRYRRVLVIRTFLNAS